MSLVKNFFSPIPWTIAFTGRASERGVSQALLPFFGDKESPRPAKYPDGIHAFNSPEFRIMNTQNIRCIHYLR